MVDEVVRRQLKVVNSQGMHARPAALLVKLANRFQCDIELIKGDMRVDAKSVIHLMTLEAQEGTTLILESRGRDAGLAADAIEKLFKEGLGDSDTPSATASA